MALDARLAARTVMCGTDASLQPDKFKRWGKTGSAAAWRWAVANGVSSMNQLFSSQKLQPFAMSGSSGQALAAYQGSNRVLATIGPSDLMAVIGFCAIGLLLTFATMARLPEFAAAIAQVGALF
jgi:hypothetical protein